MAIHFRFGRKSGSAVFVLPKKYNETPLRDERAIYLFVVFLSVVAKPDLSALRMAGDLMHTTVEVSEILIEFGRNTG